MNNENIIKLIEVLRKNFIDNYNQISYESWKEYTGITSYVPEDANILGNGYCWYFAKILYDFIPGSIICYANSHYFIKVNDFYFDYRGLFMPEWDGMKKIVEINDVIEEEGIAELSGIVSNEKDQMWSRISPKLYEIGQDFKNTLLSTQKI